MVDTGLDVAAVREHFLFPATGRVVTNNAASTQPPRELLDLFRALAPDYENVHRGQSTASTLLAISTPAFAGNFATAPFISAPHGPEVPVCEQHPSDSRRSIRPP